MYNTSLPMWNAQTHEPSPAALRLLKGLSIKRTIFIPLILIIYIYLDMYKCYNTTDVTDTFQGRTSTS